MKDVQEKIRIINKWHEERYNNIPFGSLDNYGNEYNETHPIEIVQHCLDELERETLEKFRIYVDWIDIDDGYIKTSPVLDRTLQDLINCLFIIEYYSRKKHPDYQDIVNLLPDLPL
ncbi:MAG: hypothetical protein DA328_04435 [Nitrososphaeraceae archaeon]|nr:hypothetical protein [Nitrososphaeraceae archaeon]